MPKSQSVEKKIVEAIKKAESILIASHENPDPDALGSLFGLYFILRKNFPRKKLYLYNVTPQSKEFPNKKHPVLPEFSKLNSKPPKIKYDLLIGLDAGSFSRLGLDEYSAKFAQQIIFIDHHPKDRARGDIIWIDDKEEATSNLVIRLVETARWSFNRDAATALLYGIIGDTLNFSLVRKPETFVRISELMELKPPLAEICSYSSSWKSLGEMKLFALAMLRLKFVKSKRFIWSYIRANEIKSAKVNSHGLSWVAGSLRDYRGADVALFLRESSAGHWDGSLRSAGKYPVDLGKIAQVFGGGGHFHASGFSTKLSKEKIVQKIVSVLPKRK